MTLSNLPEKYIKKEKIGKGSFSTIFKIIDSETEKEYALKRIKKKKIQKIMPQVRFELSLMTELSHPNIITCYNCYEDTAYIYLVLEYCSNGDLSTLLKCSMLNEKEVRWYFLQLVEALKYLHEQKIVHRDLKPKNILISDDNQLKLTDFGFAKNTGEEDLSSTICGSPLYMAPELLNRSPYSSVADLWSIGIVLFEMISGKTPYNANSIDDLKMKIESESQFELIDTLDVSSNCKQLLFQLLDVNHSSRMSWEDFFTHPWIENEMEEEKIKDSDEAGGYGPQFTLDTYIQDSFLEPEPEPELGMELGMEQDRTAPKYYDNELPFEKVIQEDERYVIVNHPDSDFSIIRRLRTLSNSIITFFG